jgi:DNA repair ATPase RecN
LSRPPGNSGNGANTVAAAVSLENVHQARAELAKVYLRSDIANLDEINLRIRVLQTLITSFEKTGEDVAEPVEELNERVLQSITNLEDRLRFLLNQNCHLKKEFKILTKPGFEWSEEDELKLNSRIKNKSYITVKRKLDR